MKTRLRSVAITLCFGVGWFLIALSRAQPLASLLGLFCCLAALIAAGFKD